jgi:hypothetical protein
MFAFLRQPYPLNESRRQDFLFALGVGLFVALFLFVFQPFGMSQWEDSGFKTAAIAGYGLVTFAVMLAWEFGVKRGLLRGTFTEANHTVGRQILWVSGLLLLIAAGNHLYTALLFGAAGAGRVGGLVSTLLYTLLIGVFPTVASVWLNYLYQLKKYSHPPRVEPQVEHEVPPQQGTGPASEAGRLVLTADNEKDTLELAARQLYYLESADNYCLVVYQGEKETQRELVRSSLSRLAAQIENGQIMRCHRSYVVNLEQVVKVTGNAQGYRLHLPTGGSIPVARRYNALVVERLQER